ncbi:MAG: hypothetical protein HWN68_12065 [Desulfobacterales bacterium]|nr:hypothetical protein [Desulfobacterales bacterium]
MNLIFYSRDTEAIGDQLQRVIESIETQAINEVELHRTIDSLSRRLRRPTYDVAVAVLLAATKEDLLDMLSIRDLIRNLRIILVLPDTEDATIAQGHSLRPRFLTYADSNFAEVAGVLNKMLGNTEG